MRSLKELAFYLVSNTSSPISFSKLKDLLKLGSITTVKSYIDYLENSWLFFVINKYTYSVKEQQIAAKKVYSIDTGIAESVGFSFSENTGKFMENTVFLSLKRKYQDIHYYKTNQGFEVDFFLPKENILIQVAQNFDQELVREREIRALIGASTEQKKPLKLIIITGNTKEIIEREEYSIEAIPLYEWLLKMAV